MPIMRNGLAWKAEYESLGWGQRDVQAFYKYTNVKPVRLKVIGEKEITDEDWARLDGEVAERDRLIDRELAKHQEGDTAEIPYMRGARYEVSLFNSAMREVARIPDEAGVTVTFVDGGTERT